MVLDGGKVGGVRVIPANWIAESTKPYDGPGAQPDGPLNYGFQWWTIKGTQSFTALGLQGQFIYIDPPTGAVIVKLSYFPPAGGAEGETLAFLKAAAAWTPAP